ncbi:MAG: UDP-N-acetylmuramate--L-alanine ligase, partial [Firmicutes bacterium]|nr:UDP-N-acetylmuramate--L-alanine ligase [Bacillota bacterium]
MDLKNYKHVHCVGIGGIGLSGIAEILLSRGYRVSGSDMKESAVTEMLEQQGAQVFIGHNADNLGDTDLLVYSAAVSMENPELAEARRRGIPVISRADALGAIMADYQISVAVSGTHGKTTTTSMVSLILEAANYSPTVLVGGILNQFHGNVKVGKSEYFVTEACEYMDSFLSLRPWAEIILNIDSDHLDYFKDINHIAESFGKFADKVPENGLVVAFDSNPFVKAVTENLPCRVITFGFNEASDYYAKGIKFNDEGMPSYDLYHKGEFLRRMELAVPGEHNVANSLAAAATCLALGVDLDIIEKTLESFTGTKRRFDIIGKTPDGVTVIDDYAHHPAEIKATLAAAKNLAHKKTWCLFQPHTYTRTMALFDQFADAFEDADIIV